MSHDSNSIYELHFHFDSTICPVVLKIIAKAYLNIKFWVTGFVFQNFRELSKDWNAFPGFP